MKGFRTVLKFEIMHYFKNKAFVITTTLLVVLILGALSIPTIMDLVKSGDGEASGGTEEVALYGLYDPQGAIKAIDRLQAEFPAGELVSVDSEDALNEKVLSGEFTAGYHIIEPMRYDYVVVNNEMFDRGGGPFEYAYQKVYQYEQFEAKGISYEDVEAIVYPEITSGVQVLGKDSAQNYLYTYILVFGLYFMIIMYGQLIATSVASEKSNRTMELLVTSTKSTHLIFGKVIGGAIAGAIQFGLLIGAMKIGYALNAKAWDGGLDFLLNIPGETLLQFSLFGIFGYLFYAFIYGALGALVSRTEDVGASATPITLIFVAVFMVSIMGMQNTESLVLKVASFIPFSSFMAMFVRISMGSVSTVAVVFSLVLLAVSTLFIGWIGAKIYRMGTLMYGNPVKIKDIYKVMKSQ